MNKIAVLGMGKSGQSAAKLALSRDMEVHCLDSNQNATRIQGCHHHYNTSFDVSKVNQLIVSPGVPSTNQVIQRAIANNVPIIGELGFSSQFIDTKLLAITGTNGKSSTAFYTHQMMKQAGLQSFIGGNFGIALSQMALEKNKYDVGVVEVSSYQMEFPHQFSPHAAVALNITPDHLSRHGTMEVYAQMKRRIFQHQSKKQISIVTKGEDTIYPLNNATKWWINAFPGGKIIDNTLVISTGKGNYKLPLHKLRLLGKHNKQNIIAATLLAHSIDIDLTQLNIGEIQPLEHRLEQFYSNNGVTWVNDSKATNIEATIAGIAGIAQPQIILLGGAGKEGADYSRLLPLLNKYAKHIICFGKSGNDIFKQIKGNGLSLHISVNLREAVALADSLAYSDDYVVLSPACASFDEFNNFEHRGQEYKKLIQELKEVS
jgi:UDP-N-acetylmuramoylalanine--D-glutamate ligase